MFLLGYGIDQKGDAMGEWDTGVEEFREISAGRGRTKFAQFDPRREVRTRGHWHSSPARRRHTMFSLRFRPKFHSFFRHYSTVISSLVYVSIRCPSPRPPTCS